MWEDNSDKCAEEQRIRTIDDVVQLYSKLKNPCVVKHPETMETSPLIDKLYLVFSDMDMSLMETFNFTPYTFRKLHEYQFTIYDIDKKQNLIRLNPKSKLDFIPAWFDIRYFEKVK